MPSFKSKPVVIEAIQFREDNWPEVHVFLDAHMDSLHDYWETTPTELRLLTAHGDPAIFRHGDWIVPDSQPGTFYPIKPDVFAKKYEPLPTFNEAVRSSDE